MCLLLCAQFGCATHADRVRAARSSYYDGNLLTARAKIDEQLKKGPKKENDVLLLDQSVIDLFTGESKQAKTSLREVRDRFDYLEQKSLAEGTLAMLTDENAVSYPGEDYEKIMIRVLLTLSELLEGGDDAGAYSLQIGLKQEQIVQSGATNLHDPQTKDEHWNPKLAYKMPAIGPYLRGVIREETHVNYDDAFRAYRNVHALVPDFQQGFHDLNRVQHGRHSQEGNGVLYVFTFTGRGPHKEQDSSPETQIGLLIADQIFSATNKYSVPPTIAPVPIPKIVAPVNRIDSVGTYVDGHPCGATETITNLSQIALEQYEANKQMIIAKAIMRRIVKKGTLYAVKDAADVNPWISLAMDLGGIAWEASEAADTRCWGLLPEKIQVRRIELPEGEHELSLQALERSGRAFGKTYKKTVHIRRGSNTYVLANFPDERLIGQIQSSPL